MEMKSKAVVWLAAVCCACLAAPAGAQSAAKSSKAKAQPAQGQLLDNFSKPDWMAGKDQGSDIRLSQETGPAGPALKVTYDMKGGRWVSISKGFVIEDFRGKAIQFKIRGTGASNNLEVKLVDEDDTNFGVKRAIPVKSGEWATFVFSEADFSYWWGGDPNLGRIKFIHFAVSAGDGGAGEVMFADLRLTQASKDGHITKSGVVFEGHPDEHWMLAKAEGATISLEPVSGVKGAPAMAVKYSIPEAQWVSIRRALNADLSAGTPSVVLRVKGEGAANNLEVKLVDRDDSVFGKDFEGMTATKEWTDIKIPISDFEYKWGGDNRLDTSLIRYLDLAISGPGGAGRLIVQDIRIVR